MIGLVAGFALVMDSSVCLGQQPTTSGNRKSVDPISRSGAIRGLVIDSLHGRALGNAEVLAEGKTVKITHTDSTGNFSIKGVPAGKYRLAVSHPLLDTLSISLVTPDFFVVADSMTFVRLAVPSASALIVIKCKRPLRTGGMSAIIGHIVSADSLEPVQNVEVTVKWTTYEVSKTAGVERTPHVERDTTGRDGAYKICGLPNDFEANLEARVAGELRSESRVTVPDSGATLVVRSLVLPPSSAAGSGRTALISGRVELANGIPARGSSVEISGTQRKTIADEKGKFTLDSVPVGTQTIRVRQLGYQEESIVLDVAPSVLQGMVIRLKETVPVLATVSVSTTQREHALHQVGFDQRSQHSVGHFLTEEQIARQSDFRFADLLRGIPGIRVGIDKYGDDVVSSGRAGGSMLNETYGCIQYFVDGIMWGNGALEAIGTVGDKDANKMLSRIAIEQARQLNTVLKKSEILGIEVYQGGGAPAYFNQGGHNCATIVVWTTASLSR